MIKYSITGDKSDCCGCGACYQACPTKAIRMKADSEGFYYPIIDAKLCIQCNKCQKVCPIDNMDNARDIKGCYAVQDKNTDNLSKASSGGIFGIIAKNVIEKNGVVFGAILDDKFQCNIVSTESLFTIEDMKGSKYVASRTNDTYIEVKKQLNENRLVLYSALPCQIAGLKKYLGREYDNLYTIDLICHGVPSQTIFDNYINYESRKEQVLQISFRDKSKYGAGKNFTLQYKNGYKKYYDLLNPYSYGFNMSNFSRYSCYKCKFTADNRYSDMTIGDFWGIDHITNEFDASLGVSICIVNSSKGQELYDVIKANAKTKEIDIIDAAKYNPSIVNDKNEVIPQQRYAIYDQMNNDNFWNSRKLRPSIGIILKMYIRKNIPYKVVKKIRSLIKHD